MKEIEQIIVAKKAAQALLLFPQAQYPIHRMYIDLFIKNIINHDINVSDANIQILSIALGATAHKLFSSVATKMNAPEQLECLVINSLKLKVEVKKRLSLHQTEFSNDANSDVAKLVISQYRKQLDELEKLKQQVVLHQQQQELKKRSAQVEAVQKKLLAEKEEYKASHVDFEDFELNGIKRNSRVDKLLSQLRQKTINSDEFKWLSDMGFVTDSIEKKYHLQLAHKHYQNWKQKNLLWELVNASAAYRKAEQLTKIKKALDGSYPFNTPKKEKKLKSALLTTYGGVCRDLEDFEEGVKLGTEAHQVTPLNFRPCTLLGAIYLSTGKFDLGHEWYSKAKERGFSQDAYDNDIKSVYFRASDEMKKRLKQNLLSTGHKYKWL